MQQSHFEQIEFNVANNRKIWYDHCKNDVDSSHLADLIGRFATENVYRLHDKGGSFSWDLVV